MPANNAFDQTYILGSGLTTINFGAISNDECQFETLVYYDSIGNSAPISDIGLTLTAPVLDLQSLSSYQYQVTTDGYLDLDSDDLSLINQIVIVYVIVNSQQNAADTVTATFTF